VSTFEGPTEKRTDTQKRCGSIALCIAVRWRRAIKIERADVARLGYTHSRAIIGLIFAGYIKQCREREKLTTHQWLWPVPVPFGVFFGLFTPASAPVTGAKQRTHTHGFVIIMPTE